MLNNMTVTHLYYSSAHCCGFRVVSNHDDGLIETVIQFLKHIKDKRGVLRVQISCGFVRQYDRRSGHHGPGQRYALLLTA